MDAAASTVFNAEIRAILQAPGVDLSTISSKRVRKELADKFGQGVVKQNKEALDALIIEAFNDIATASGAAEQVGQQHAEQVSAAVIQASGAVTNPHTLPNPHATAINGQHSTNTTATSIAAKPSPEAPPKASGSGTSTNYVAAREGSVRKAIKDEESEQDESDGESQGSQSSDYNDYGKRSRGRNPRPAHKAKAPSQKKRLLEADEPGPSSPAVPIASKIKAEPQMTDEEYARRLQAEFNAAAGGRTTRGTGTGSSSRRAKGATTTKSGRSIGASGKKIRTKAYVNDSDLEDDDGVTGQSEDADSGSAPPASRPKKRKRAAGDGTEGGGGNTGGGYNKPLALSESLQQVCGEPTMSRPQIVKRLWIYIREHELQDPSNRKNIINDELFQDIFGVKTMTAFSLNKYLKKSVWPIDG